MIDFSKIEFKETPSVQDFATRIRGGIVITAEVTIQDIHSSREVDVRKFAREQVLRILHHKVYGELRRPIMELLAAVSKCYDFETVQQVRKLQEELLELLAVPK